MTIPTIFETCRPRSDVLKGAIAEADFAADLAQVITGSGNAEYLDPARFFAITYPTRGLKNLLANVCRPSRRSATLCGLRCPHYLHSHAGLQRPAQGDIARAVALFGPESRNGHQFYRGRREPPSQSPPHTTRFFKYPFLSVLFGPVHSPLNGSNNSTSNFWKSRMFLVATVSR